MFNDYLSYEDGLLKWKVNRGRVKVGDTAGTPMTTEWGHTYLKVRCCGEQYLVHRVIWQMFNGEIPEKMVIDHIDGNTMNNKIENLRLCTNTQNAQNIHHGRGKYSTKKGVSFSKKQNKFVAQININGKNTWLGSFDSEEDAFLAYEEAGKYYFGEFFNGGE